jgi:Insertion element 4 transposase N-terminal/Transposase DDE domain
MPRTRAELPPRSQITDYISLGVLAKTFPSGTVQKILKSSGKESIRERDLPAPVVVYYVIALSLYMQSSCREVLRCLWEGVQWLTGPSSPIKVTGRAGISQARKRMGSEPLRQLHDTIVEPIATAHTKGAWYRRWRLVSLDGSTLEVAGTTTNTAEFGKASGPRGSAAYPQIRFVSLIENGTHVLFGSRMGGYTTSEHALAQQVIPALSAGMLCLADRLFASYSLWSQGQSTGADLLWRVGKTFLLPPEKRLPDGSFLSSLYSSVQERQRQQNAISVRVIEYRLEGVAEAESRYRLITTILGYEKAPAEELASLYHERWEIETALDELKTHLRGGRIVLRSKMPDLVRQEFYGLLMAHFAVRSLMHDAALRAHLDPDRLSFLHAVRVIRRKLPLSGALSPSGPKGVSSSHSRGSSARTCAATIAALQRPRHQAKNEQLSTSAMPGPAGPLQTSGSNP